MAPARRRLLLLAAEQGLVAAELEESPGGPARKYYRLTPRGEAALIEMNAAWDRIEAGVKTLRKGEDTCST